jgi:hypothetical protein
MTGRLYTKDGKFVYDLWPAKDEENYKNRVYCFIHQFNNYTIPGTGGTKVLRYFYERTSEAIVFMSLFIFMLNSES